MSTSSTNSATKFRPRGRRQRGSAGERRCRRRWSPATVGCAGAPSSAAPPRGKRNEEPHADRQRRVSHSSSTDKARPDARQPGHADRDHQRHAQRRARRREDAIDAVEGSLPSADDALRLAGQESRVGRRAVDPHPAVVQARLAIVGEHGTVGVRVARSRRTTTRQPADATMPNGARAATIPLAPLDQRRRRFRSAARPARRGLRGRRAVVTHGPRRPPQRVRSERAGHRQSARFARS